MAKGRKRIAQEVHAAKGSYRKNPQRENKRAPLADGREPEPPDYFGKEELGKWSELVVDLRNNGILSLDLRESMIAYCEAFGCWMRARRAVKKTGMVLKVQTETGVTYKRNPYTVEMHKHRDVMNRLLPEFGLTPASRSKLVSMKDPEDESVFGALLARMSGVN